MFTLQLLGWGVILGLSLFWSFGSSSENIDSYGVARFTLNVVIPLMFIYLLNYTIIIPQFLFGESKMIFFVANAILIVLLLVGSYSISEFDVLGDLRPKDAPHRDGQSMVFLVRDLINYVLMIGLVTALRLSERLQQSEEALREAESAMVKAELANLRSQINPHFLLNTLNNIYALTAIDTDKAQKTIKELSDLLRYILYDNLNERVLLRKEVEFLKSYIELMSIRLPRKVQLTTEFKISQSRETYIAPLIFISLIENAFKHSVSGNGEGYITICFEESEQLGEVTLSIKNSNHAKQDHDKSGHGIGLEQVRRRLELLYGGGSYRWSVEQNKDEYCSVLTLKCSL
ncbi:MAG: sensor histidine kinase [Rikenellaceae bacterium]